MENQEAINTAQEPEDTNKTNSISDRTTNETATSQEPRQKRTPRGSVPPSLTLQEAIDIARKIYELTGGAAPLSAAPDITGNSASSSTFSRKLITLRQYGVVYVEDETMRLTDLGQSLVAPKSEDEHTDALKRTFLKIDVFFKIYERFKGRPLPQDVFFLNALAEYVPKDLTESWLDKFKRSAKTAGLLEERDDKFYVLDKQKLPQESEVEPSPTVLNAEPIIEKQELVPVSTRTPIVLGPGRWAYIELPPDWRPKELRKLIKILELALSEDSEALEGQ